MITFLLLVITFLLLMGVMRARQQNHQLRERLAKYEPPAPVPPPPPKPDRNRPLGFALLAILVVAFAIAAANGVQKP